MPFAIDAIRLRQQEITRISDAIVPRLDALRRMTASGFRSVIGLMLERFGHTLVTDPATHADLITTKNGAKFITACGCPTDLTATGIRELAALHDAVVTLNATRGFFITPRHFSAAAELYALSAPLDLFDGKRLVKALNQSRKHVLMPQTYSAMCQLCGDIVQHRLDRDQDDARPCANGHLVAPTIARAMLLPPRPSACGANPNPSVPRPYSRREIRAHNATYEARMMRKPRMQ